jgi:hypothetical protein
MPFEIFVSLKTPNFKLSGRRPQERAVSIEELAGAKRGDLHFQHSFHLFTFMAPHSAQRQVPVCSKGAHSAHSTFFSSLGLSTILSLLHQAIDASGYFTCVPFFARPFRYTIYHYLIR